MKSANVNLLSAPKPSNAVCVVSFAENKPFDAANKTIEAKKQVPNPAGKTTNRARQGMGAQKKPSHRPCMVSNARKKVFGGAFQTCFAENKTIDAGSKAFPGRWLHGNGNFDGMVGFTLRGGGLHDTRCGPCLQDQLTPSSDNAYTSTGSPPAPAR